MSNEAYWREKYLELLNQKAPQRTWVGLTDEEMFKTWLTVPAETEERLAFGRAVEAKLKEKNFD